MTESDIEQSPHSNVTSAYLATLVQEAKDKFKVPAIAVSTMSTASIFAQAALGERTVDKPEQVTLDDYFHLGSCARSVLAVMAAKLVEQGQIKYDTKFFDLFPELELRAERAYLSITLEDLLLCRAGIRAYTDLNKDPLPVYPSSIHAQRQEFVNRLVEQSVAGRKVNGKFQYMDSNASYTMAAVMLERVTGLTYEAHVQSVMQSDLGLAAQIGWPAKASADQPWGHVINNGNVKPVSPTSTHKVPYLLTPAGDLSLTHNDFARYVQWHLRGLKGIDGYLTSEAIDHIHFGHAGYSLGVKNGSLGGKRYSYMDGNGGTFYCRFATVPDADFGLALMMNAHAPKAAEWLTTRIAKKHFNWWWKFWL